MAGASIPPDLDMAEKLKEQANAAFQACKFVQARNLYSQALELNSKNPVYWANRAFTNLKLEEYGSAIIDATKAIEADPSYIKGYYRRGAAYLALGKFQDGMKDFRQVCKIVPKNPDALKKLRECESALKKLKFEEALDSGDNHTVADSVNYQDIAVEESYTGARIEGDKPDLEFVKNMIADFKDQKRLHKRYVYQLLLQVLSLFTPLPNVIEITIPENRHLTVCGDIHGQFYDLLHIFELNGLPSDENPYIFNGDFVDRGSFSLEVILTLFALKCVYPSGLYLARGNHESKSMNKIYGFDGEVKAKYISDMMTELFSEIFCALPLAHVLNKKVFVVHGGLFSTDNVRLADLQRVHRFRQPPDEGLMCEMLWSDPHPETGRRPSKRGVGLSFGSDVTAKFLKLNDLDLVVRSHEVKDDGYEIEHTGKCITVFSAPNYCDQMGNKGAFVRFEAPELKPKFTTYSAVPHPPIKPMAYAPQAYASGFGF